MKQESSGYSLRIPNSLIQEICNTAQGDGVSINQFICLAVAEKVSALRTAEYFTQRAARGDINKALSTLDRAGTEVPRQEDRII